MASLESQPRSAHILKLPTEILAQVFAYIRPIDLELKPGRLNYAYVHSPFHGIRESILDIKSARRVCRRFNEIASARLVPVLRISVFEHSPRRAQLLEQFPSGSYDDTCSLSSAYALTQNPWISAGIRLVQVTMQYRPKEIASDPALFQQWCYDNALKFCQPFLSYSIESEDVYMSSEQELQAETAGEFLTMVQNWDRSLEFSNSTEYVESPLSEFDQDASRALGQAYLHNKELHDEQFRIIEDGSFARDLAAVTKRMPNLIALYLTDREDEITRMMSPRSRLPTLFKFREILPLIQETCYKAWNWREMKEYGKAGLLPTPAKLLWQIPIAMYDSGVRLRELAIAAMPYEGFYDLLCPFPDGGSTTGPRWDRLHLASQSFEAVTFGASGGCMNFQDIRLKWKLAEKVHVDCFLGALLSGPRLRRIDLGFHSMSINKGRSIPHREANARRFYELGPVIQAVSWPRLESLSLSHVLLQADELKDLFKMLSASNLRYLHMFRVGVLSGGWAAAVDILRAGVVGRASKAALKAKLSSMFGGGFDVVAPPPRPTPMLPSFSSDDENEGINERNLCRDVQRYLAGLEEISNPLLEWESGSV